MSEIEYLAGLIDGDGNIQLSFHDKSKHNRHPRFRPRLKLMLNGSNELEEFLVKMGFIKYKQESKKAGIYTMEDKKAVNLIKKIIPHLKIKRRRAELVVKAYENMPGYNMPYTKEIVLKNCEMLEEIHDLAVRKRPIKWTTEKILNSFGFGDT